MATLANVLETAVYNEAYANSTLWNSVSGRFKHGRPMAGWTTPYVLYSFGDLEGVSVCKKNTPSATPVKIYFDIFSTSEYFAECSTIASYIETVFDGAGLTMTGYTDMTVKLVAERPIEDAETGMWHYQLVYAGVACAT